MVHNISTCERSYSRSGYHSGPPLHVRIPIANVARMKGMPHEDSHSHARNPSKHHIKRSTTDLTYATWDINSDIPVEQNYTLLHRGP